MAWAGCWRSLPHAGVEDPARVRNAIRYVLLNAARHHGTPLQRNIDPASSGRWLTGGREGRTRAQPRSAARAVAGARTWLLAQGWRRAGLIDPSEVPGGARASPV